MLIRSRHSGSCVVVVVVDTCADGGGNNNKLPPPISFCLILFILSTVILNHYPVRAHSQATIEEESELNENPISLLENSFKSSSKLLHDDEYDDLISTENKLTEVSKLHRSASFKQVQTRRLTTRSLKEYFSSLIINDLSEAKNKYNSSSSSSSDGEIHHQYYYIQIAAIHIENSEFPLSKLLFKLTLQLALEETEKRLERRRVKLLLNFRNANTCSRQYAGAVAAEEYYLKRARFFIVSGCDEAIRGVSRLASQWRVPVMTAAGFGADLNDKQVHRGLIRVAFSMRIAVEFLIKLLKSFDWRRVNLIVDESDANSVKLQDSIKEHVSHYKTKHSLSSSTSSSTPLKTGDGDADNQQEFQLNLNTISLDFKTLTTLSENSSSSISSNSSSSTYNFNQQPQAAAGKKGQRYLNEAQFQEDKWPSEISDNIIRDALKQSSLFSRVNILLIPQQYLRKFMLSVYDQQMASGLYTFINMPLLLITSSQDQVDNSMMMRTNNNNNNQSSSYAISTGDNVFLWRSMKSNRNQQAKQAFESLMSIYLRNPTSKAYIYFASKLSNLANTDYATTTTTTTTTESSMIKVEQRTRNTNSSELHHSIPSNDKYNSNRWPAPATNANLASAAVSSRAQLNINPYSASFYDCLQIYSIALDESLELIQKEYLAAAMGEKNATTNLHKNNNATTVVPLRSSSSISSRGGKKRIGFDLHSRIIELVKGRKFENLVTGTVFINENGDRVTDYTLDDLNQMTGIFQSVRLFRGETRQIDRLAKIHWSSDESIGQTIDSVDCRLIGTCPSRPFSRFFVTFFLLALPLVVLMGSLLYFIYNRINLESQLVDYWWKINFKDIELIQARRKNGADGSSIGLTGGADSQVSSSHANQSSLTRRTNANQKQQQQQQNRRNNNNNQPLGAGGTNEAESMSEIGATGGGGAGAKSTVTKVTIDTSAAFASSAADFCYGNISLGSYKLTKVAIKPISKFHQSRKLMIELRKIKNVSHNNLCRFVGIVVDEPNLSLVSEFCPKGSLREFFQNESMVIDWTFKYSIINDIIAGLLYLHSSSIEFHGRLKSTNCLVSSRFVVKLTDYGLSSLREKLDENDLEDDELGLIRRQQLYMAPEHLNRKCLTNGFNGSKKGDVYSFGLILYEIITNSVPFYNSEKNDYIIPLKSLVNELRTATSLPCEKIGPDMRIVEDQINAIKLSREQQSTNCQQQQQLEDKNNTPQTNQLAASSSSPAIGNIEALVDLMKQCWLTDPNKRPSSLVVGSALKRITRGVTSKKLLENLTGRMEQYTNNLESLIDAKLATLVEEKQKTEELLYQFVPKSIASLLKEDQAVEPEAFDCVTVFYSDIVGFTSLSSESSPIEVIDFLSSLYLCFDETLEQYDIFKVDTIGDAYIVASGLPQRNDGKHVIEIARVALELRERLASFKIPHKPGRSLQMRVGIHSGPCIAGIVGGLNMPKYCVFGDTLAIGKFMESSGHPMRIHITEDSKKLLEAIDIATYKIEPRVPKISKDGIPFQTYWLEYAN